MKDISIAVVEVLVVIVVIAAVVVNDLSADCDHLLICRAVVFQSQYCKYTCQYSTVLYSTVKGSQTGLQMITTSPPI